ncbi:MAG: DUF261 family protein [Deltaproteobacteria bacterium]|nr:DUF261 family protein [Deltaproteobacteria bacterium]
MILQTDPILNEYINKYGCYFMSILFLVNKHTSRGFDRADINHIYDRLTDPKIANNWMTVKCFLNNPQVIFTFLGLPMAGVMKAHPRYDTSAEQLEILRFERSYTNRAGELITYGHFVAGNGDGHIAYDPAGNSNAVKYGFLESKRIFTRR